MRIRTGIDAVEVPRFRVALERTPQIVERLFTQAEFDSVSGRPESLAARFAVKEATMKLLGVGLGSVRFQEIETLRLPSGAPVLKLSGGAAQRAGDGGFVEFSLSLTHTKMLAIAHVVALIEE
ncbi:MAG: holo-ACP synthase [Ferrimicrobium sp.]|uniref:holo-ACP synthase n=1 Tax=Ferrimicrobium sp. TaxID=2926050 RepID=UPI00262BECA8|nr:holo-ACP synthase [Ferrimicrobium sp.]